MENLRINVPLERGELQALISMSKIDCRHPREQMRYILREEAHRRGLLSEYTSDCEAKEERHAEAR